MSLTLVDLGSSPLSNAYLTSVSLRRPERWFPLRVLVCQECWLVQAEAYSRASEIFNEEYAYFSSFSREWLAHARGFFEESMVRLQLSEDDLVVEVGSNDGYLLQFFSKAGIPCLGVEPTASTSAVSRFRGIETLEEFFDRELALEMRNSHGAARLIVANNVLAHTPDPNSFLSGIECLLRNDGIASFEFPHLLELIGGRQFDTIYHEHFSYFSFTAVTRLLIQNGLTPFRVEVLSTHGGSLRVWARRRANGAIEVETSVAEMLDREACVALTSRSFYEGFQHEVDRIKNAFVAFLLEASSQGALVCGYGAAAKGNTLLNYGGVKKDLVSFVSDRNPAKQGKYLPGSRIPILPESAIGDFRPDYVVILPWNIRDEVEEQLGYVRGWGAKFVVAIPALEIW